MAMLDQLTLASASPQRDRSPNGRFRRRLAEALDLQIDIAKADGAGIEFRRTRQRWIKNEDGGKELREVPVRLKRWWWKDDAGTIYLALRHGAKLLEIAPGKRAIEIGAIEQLPQKLSILREAVRAGELDACMASMTAPLPSAKKARAEGASPKAAATKGGASL